MHWFSGKPDVVPSPNPVTIDAVNRDVAFGPEHYEADSGLAQAVNVSLYLQQPLLICGEAGSGKTSLAHRVAWELGMAEFKFEAKSTSQAQDLFYQFDALGRFQAAHGSTGQEAIDPLRFISYGALGRAILQGLGGEEAKRFFHRQVLPPWLRQKPQRAVVLIDEIDKAPRDFPNDILNELEQHYFRIHEVEDLAVGLDPDGKTASNEAPIVIITSNLERQLPDAFLRRCVFYALPKIDRVQLERIVLRRLTGKLAKSSPLLRDALDCFFELRKSAVDMSKPPSTAEFVGWICALLRAGALESQPLDARLACHCVAALTKTEADQAKALEILSDILGRR